MSAPKILRRLAGGYVVIEGPDGESVKVLASELEGKRSETAPKGRGRTTTKKTEESE